MSNLTDKASYLKGLAEGMNLNPEKVSHRLIGELIELTNAMAAEIESLSKAQTELNEFAEAIDTDLANIEEILFDDGTINAEETEGEEIDPAASDVEITYSCPGCGKELHFNVSEIDFETYRCPECNELVFPEVTEEEEEDSSEDVMIESED